jgi:hypothetical protein
LSHAWQNHPYFLRLYLAFSVLFNFLHSLLTFYFCPYLSSSFLAFLTIPIGLDIDLESYSCLNQYLAFSIHPWISLHISSFRIPFLAFFIDLKLFHSSLAFSISFTRSSFIPIAFYPSLTFLIQVSLALSTSILLH